MGSTRKFSEWLKNHPCSKRELWLLQNSLETVLGKSHPIYRKALKAWKEASEENYDVYFASFRSFKGFTEGCGCCVKSLARSLSASEACREMKRKLNEDHPYFDKIILTSFNKI